jgi:hypothetical protein
MSHSEKNGPALPIRSPELKSEMAANIGLIANNLVQRTAGCGQAGGESGIRTHSTFRVVDNPLTSKAGMADRTGFAPERTSPERKRMRSKSNANRARLAKRAFMLPLITIFLQVLFLR